MRARTLTHTHTHTTPFLSFDRCRREVIVGLRAGLLEHGDSNERTLLLELDDSDQGGAI